MLIPAKPTKDLHPVYYLPLATTKWCVQCNALFSADQDTCPACANRLNLVNLSHYFRSPMPDGTVIRE